VNAPANEAHPLAQWLRRTADLLDRVYMRCRDRQTGRWGNVSLAELEVEEAAAHVARWLLEGHVPVAVATPEHDAVSGERAVSQLLLKKNGLYQDVEVALDLERGKFWLHLDDGETLCIEAPRLRRIVERYDEHLAASGLPPLSEDAYGR
jgi:hypothetical protein